MIMRIWRGVAPGGSQADTYIEHLNRTVLPGLAGVEGFLGIQLLAREAEEGVEFLVTTRWESVEAVRAFAGEEAERAVVEPEARSLLSEFDEFVRHYVVVQESGPGDDLGAGFGEAGLG